MATVAMALAAAGLLLRPAVSARRVADEAESALDRMGAPAGKRSGFEVRRLWARETMQVPVETRRVGEGLELDFYRAVGNAKAPCVIVVHGGGWDGGDRKQMPEMNHWFARRGYAVAAVSYRLAPEHRWPAQRDDVRAAIAWIKAHAEELGVDAARLVLCGRSAGGQIALNVAYTAGDPAIRGAIALYAPADLILGYESGREDDALGSRRLLRQYLGGTPDEVRAVYEEASATTHVTRESPPTLLLHGKLDTLVWERHTERLAGKLKEHDVPHAVVWLPWATHAFEYELNGPGGQVTLCAIERFLRRVSR
jgi:acetyl esterase/lipase